MCGCGPPTPIPSHPLSLFCSFTLRIRTPKKEKKKLSLQQFHSFYSLNFKELERKKTLKTERERDTDMYVLGASSSHILYAQLHQHQFLSNGKRCGFLNTDFGDHRRRELRIKAEAGFWPDLSRPASVEMESIDDSDQLDRILIHAQQLSQPILIDWMATWCRKCIYLKPKLEKLAADYVTKVKFYYVDVNKVPQSLVKRGNISKMPTIQLWKDGEMKAEVIGGHKAWLVIEEVREMIQKFAS